MVIKPTAIRCLLLAATLSFAASCATPTKLSSTWHDQATVGDPFATLLVVGVSDDSGRRRRFEALMVQALQESGNLAEASIRAMPNGQPLNRDSITEAMRATEAQAVVVTRLVSREVTAQEVAGRSGVKTRRKDEYAYDFFRYDYKEYEEPGYLVAKNTVTLSTDLYNSGDGALVYSIETTIYEKETEFEIFDEASTAIVRRLRRDGLIR
jgi:hypothetical protein